MDKNYIQIIFDYTWEYWNYCWNLFIIIMIYQIYINIIYTMLLLIFTIYYTIVIEN